MELEFPKPVTASAEPSDAVYRVGFGQSRRSQAVQDICSGLAAWDIWALLGWQDIKQRYRRSMLGPLWLTISTAVMIGVLSFLYGALFRLPVDVYAPFVGVGVVVWNFISMLLNEACNVFISVEAIVKQVRVPLTLHVCRMVWRNFVVFLHNALVVIPIYLVFGKGWHWDLLLVAPALLAIALNGVWTGIALGILCTRFRDIPPIVVNLVQVVFFVTPIMWLPELLSARGLTWVVSLNPMHHFVEIVRAPVLGTPVPLLSWAVVTAVSVVGWLIALALLERFRHRVPYWL